MKYLTLSERIRAARTAAQITQQSVADACGISREAVSQWESERSPAKPSLENLKILAEVTGMPIDWLLDNKATTVPDWLPMLGRRVGEPTQPVRAYSVRVVDGDDGINPETDVLIPEVDVRLSGGQGAWIPEFIETKFEMPFQAWWFQKHGAKPADVRLMRVDGHSMERTLYHDDRVAINFGDNLRVRDGRVYAVIVGQEAKVKRLFNTRDGGLRIVSDNHDKELYPDEIVPAADMHTILLLGRVIDKSGSGGL